MIGEPLGVEKGQVVTRAGTKGGGTARRSSNCTELAISTKFCKKMLQRISGWDLA